MDTDAGRTDRRKGGGNEGGREGGKGGKWKEAEREREKEKERKRERDRRRLAAEGDDAVAGPHVAEGPPQRVPGHLCVCGVALRCSPSLITDPSSMVPVDHFEVGSDGEFKF